MSVTSLVGLNPLPVESNATSAWTVWELRIARHQLLSQAFLDSVLGENHPIHTMELGAEPKILIFIDWILNGNKISPNESCILLLFNKCDSPSPFPFSHTLLSKRKYFNWFNFYISKILKWFNNFALFVIYSGNYMTLGSIRI